MLTKSIWRIDFAPGAGAFGIAAAGDLIEEPVVEAEQRTEVIDYVEAAFGAEDPRGNVRSQIQLVVEEDHASLAAMLLYREAKIADVPWGTKAVLQKSCTSPALALRARNCVLKRFRSEILPGGLRTRSTYVMAAEPWAVAPLLLAEDGEALLTEDGQLIIE